MVVTLFTRNVVRITVGHAKYNNAVNESAASFAPALLTLRSVKTFSFKDHCLLCGNHAMYDDRSKKRFNEVFPMRT